MMFIFYLLNLNKNQSVHTYLRATLNIDTKEHFFLESHYLTTLENMNTKHNNFHFSRDNIIIVVGWCEQNYRTNRYVHYKPTLFFPHSFTFCKCAFLKHPQITRET